MGTSNTRGDISPRFRGHWRLMHTSSSALIKLCMSSSLERNVTILHEKFAQISNIEKLRRVFSALVLNLHLSPFLNSDGIFASLETDTAGLFAFYVRLETIGLYCHDTG